MKKFLVVLGVLFAASCARADLELAYANELFFTGPSEVATGSTVRIYVYAKEVRNMFIGRIDIDNATLIPTGDGKPGTVDWLFRDGRDPGRIVDGDIVDIAGRRNDIPCLCPTAYTFYIQAPSTPGTITLTTYDSQTYTTTGGNFSKSIVVTPEPATTALLGLGSLAFMRRRR